MAIPDCQLNYIWDELQSRIGGFIWDPDLEDGRHKFLTWILAWRSWGIVAMKSLGSGEIVHAFSTRRLRQGDLGVQGQPGTKQIPDPGLVAHTFNLAHTSCWPTPLIWPHLTSTSSSGRGKKEDLLFFATCIYVPAHLLESTSVEDQLKQLASWAWATFPFTDDHCWGVGLQTVKLLQQIPSI